MISFADAQKIVLSHARELPSEKVSLGDALNRVLAEDIISDVDMPPFDKAAMDGYACRRSDLDHELTLTEVIAAGSMPAGGIGPLQCAKIMTGAMVPEGADCIIMLEHVDELDNGKIRCREKDTDSNICCRGEDVKVNDPGLARGTLIRPQHVAVMAMYGVYSPGVTLCPRVGVIATGSELVEIHKKPRGPQIRNSNSPQLSAQAMAMGCRVINYGIVPDSSEVIDDIFRKAVSENDVVLISGGMSMGDFDFVPGVMQRNGIEIHFSRVNVKPGRPMTFGTSPDRAVFGFPGNPVSTFVLFEVLAKPFLYRMMGYDFREMFFRLPIGETISRIKAERENFIPVRIDKGTMVMPIEYNGSANISSFSEADGLISFPVGTTEIAKGSMVDVRPI